MAVGDGRVLWCTACVLAASCKCWVWGTDAPGVPQRERASERERELCDAWSVLERETQRGKYI